MSFTHLQVKSGYSLMDSTITIEKLVNKAAELEFKAIALTDEEVLYGTIPFYKACVKRGIKPIIGMVIRVLDIAEKTERCILLAKSNQGYKELLKISTYIQQNGQKGIEISELKTFTEDLICILPISGSTLINHLEQSSHEVAFSYINQWQQLFSKENFFLGIQEHVLVGESNLDQTIQSFQLKYDIPLVAIQDVLYLNEDDWQAYEYLQAIKDDRSYKRMPTMSEFRDRHLRASHEMEKIWLKKYPEALKMTQVIADKCNVTFDFNKRWLPAFPVPSAQDAHHFLEEMCFEKVKEKYPQVEKEVSERLAYELDIIKKMQFSDYFLIVADFIHYAKQKGILVGPGRGSAAGSIVAYVLGITDVDPIHYDLIFERFLNPERVTMPDIDVDFSDHRRDEVIDYVNHKYGKEHVAQIITFGTFGTRSVLRALFKAMQIDEKDADFILREIPRNTHQSITFSVKSSEHLKDYVMQSEKLKLLFKIAAKLEGLPRHISTHAAGVVMSDQSLIEHVPLTSSSHTANLTQYAMNDLESLGLLKMDFLGLRNLTFLEHIMESIQYHTSEQIELSALPQNDKKAFKLLQEGKTNGIFQLESAGMKNVLRQLRPTSFEDIVAVNALYRPGPMETIPSYIKRKHGEEAVTFLHPDLAPILRPTYGVLIYQEQIMQIAYKFAGFSLGKADILRRAVSKKDEKLMAEQREHFINGCLENGYDQEVAKEIFTWIVKFSNYGFNKSHAVAYSKISYQLAYLKAHYPTHFFKTLLSAVVNQNEKINLYSKEAKELGIMILPPTINASYGGYTVEKNAIRMGLLSISGIGHQIVKEITSVRKKRPFTSLFDFCLRVSLQIINRRIIETLILAGTFDETNPNRASLLASIDQAMDQGELFGGVNHQSSLLPNRFGINEAYAQIEDFSQLKKLADEKNLIGMYVSAHPLKPYRRNLTLEGYITLSQSYGLVNQKNAKAIVIIQAIKQIRTKRGDPMAFLTIGDETGDIDAVVFPELYRRVGRRLNEEMMVYITGKIEQRNNKIQWIINDIEACDENTLEIEEERIFIKLTQMNNEHALTKIRELTHSYSGQAIVIVHDSEKKKTIKLAEHYCLSPTTDCINALKEIFGSKNVVLKK